MSWKNDLMGWLIRIKLINTFTTTYEIRSGKTEENKWKMMLKRLYLWSQWRKSRAGSVETNSHLCLTLYQREFNKHYFHGCSVELFLRLMVCIFKENVWICHKQCKAIAELDVFLSGLRCHRWILFKHTLTSVQKDKISLTRIFQSREPS